MGRAKSEESQFKFYDMVLRFSPFLNTVVPPQVLTNRANSGAEFVRAPQAQRKPQQVQKREGGYEGKHKSDFSFHN